MSDTTDKITKLQELGLSELEAHIYLALTSVSAVSALSLSRSLAVPRTSVYDALMRLIEKGLVEKVVKSKSTWYKASPVSVLGNFVEEQGSKLASMKEALDSLTLQLKNRAGDLKTTEVRYYEGAEGMRQMVWNCLKAKKEIVGYSVFGRVDVVGLKFYQRFVSEFAARSLADRVIASPTKRTLDYIFKDVKPGFHQLSFQNIRSLPENKLYIAGDTMIYNDTYAVSYWEGHEVVGVEIENADFVRHELSIFELLWDLASPVSL